MTAGKIFLTVALLSAVLAGPARAIDNIVLQSGGGIYSIKTSSLRSEKFRGIIAQQRDFSCGSAVLATLLHYHYNRPVTETDALQAMYEVGDKQKIEKEGFSLLDMKSYLDSIGLHSEGYSVPLDTLAQVGIPAIALVNLKGYLHFVLIRGVTKEKVAVADPALGSRIFDRGEFEKIWNKIVFVVLDDKPLGRKHFNLAKYWGKAMNSHDLSQVIAGGDIALLTRHITYEPGYF